MQVSVAAAVSPTTFPGRQRHWIPWLTGGPSGLRQDQGFEGGKPTRASVNLLFEMSKAVAPQGVSP